MMNAIHEANAAVERAAVPEPLEDARRALESQLGSPIAAVGLFQRVESAGFVARVLGSMVGVVLAVVVLAMASLVTRAIGLSSSGSPSGGSQGIVGLMALVACVGIGQVSIARLFRKAKDVPDNFAVAVATDGLHVLSWCHDAKSIRLGAPIRFWAKDSVVIKAGDIQMRPAGIPSAASVPTQHAGVAFNVNGETLFQALVCSVSANKGNVGVYQSAQSNRAFELLKRDYGI